MQYLRQRQDRHALMHQFEIALCVEITICVAVSGWPVTSRAGERMTTPRFTHSTELVPETGGGGMTALSRPAK